MEGIKDVLKGFKIEKPKSKAGASYGWQDRAVDVWNKLGIQGKPSGKWFRVFKLYPGLCERAYSNMSDAGSKEDPEKYFYWLIGKYRKEVRK